MDHYTKRTEKLLARINELAAFSEDGQALTRTFGSKAFVAAGKKIFSWMKEAGLQTRIDNIGNIRGRWVSKNHDAKTFIIASHFDSVVNAGKFDGPLGVVMGIDLVENFIIAKTDIPFNIEVIAFSDEEGVRFHSTYLGSKVVAGTFDSGLLQKKDALGISVNDIIDSLGGESKGIAEDAISPDQLSGYFEIHIEQGPVLYETNVPVAIVTGIAGQKRAELVFKGFAGHAGTVPMNMREDALCAAAACILEIESFALLRKNILATVGKLHIINGASNVIPGEVLCSLDLRSADETVLDAGSGNLHQICEAVCKKRNIVLEWNPVQSTKPVACDERINHLLQQAIAESGYEIIKVVSGAGHDAVAISAIAPVSMMFVRCFNVEPADVRSSLIVAEKFINKLILKANSI
jgi:allantoate deiminase